MHIQLRAVTAPKHNRKDLGLQSEDAFAHTSYMTTRPFAAVVADGHGERAVNKETRRFARMVAEFLCDRPEGDEARLCQNLQEILLQQFGRFKNGAVATRLVLTDTHWRVMSVGDVRAYQFFWRGKDIFQQLTQDHHASNQNERNRIAPHIFPDVKDSPFYFHPMMSENPTRLVRIMENFREGLAVTRSFGDPLMRPVVTSVPSHVSGSLNLADRNVFFLCSDGGNAVVESAAQLARNSWRTDLDGLLACVRECTPKNPRDDVTILIIEIAP